MAACGAAATLSNVEFIVFQIASVVFAGVVGVAFQPVLSVLQLLGLACIEFVFTVMALRVVKYIKQRNEGGICDQGLANSRYKRTRDWRLLMLRSALIGLFSGVIAADVHPLMAQLGAVYIGLVIAGYMALLWRRFVKQM